MSYDDDERRREYNRQLDRQREREDERRRNEDMENRRRDRETRDLRDDRAIELIEKGHLDAGFTLLDVPGYVDASPPLSDVPSDGSQLPSQSEWQPAAPTYTSVEVIALNQLHALRAFEYPEVMHALKGPAQSTHDRVFWGVMLMGARLNEEITRQTQRVDEHPAESLDRLFETSRLNYLITQKTQLQANLDQLVEEHKQETRRIIESK